MLPTIIIADIGSNHLKQEHYAHELIRKAAQAGADVAKFQFFKAYGSWRTYEGEAAWTDNELPVEWIPELAKECELAGIEFMCSVFDIRDIKILRPYIKTWKVASIAALDTLLLLELQKTGLPILISTGYLHWSDFYWLANFCFSLSIPATFMYCVADYPCESKKLNLKSIPEILKVNNEIKAQAKMTGTIGFSDHSLSLLSGAIAVSMGATVIEKHLKFSLKDSTYETADTAHSLDPEQFGLYVKNIREAESMIGSSFLEKQILIENGKRKEQYAYIPCLERIMNKINQQELTELKVLE